MSRQANLNEVRWKVRHNALVLREFTAKQMIRATNLKPESVRTELKRMKREGLLEAVRMAKESPGRGAPPVQYKLPADFKARLRLARSVDTFIGRSSLDHPSSRQYFSLQQLLDRALTAEATVQADLLDKAGRELELAEQAEGGKRASPAVKAHLDYERARLHYLRGEYDRARELFQQLRTFFAEANKKDMLERVDEFLLCLQLP